MKNLEFMELNAQELEEVNGGIIWLLLAIAYDIVSNWDDSTRSFSEGMEYRRNM